MSSAVASALLWVVCTPGCGSSGGFKGGLDAGTGGTSGQGGSGGTLGTGGGAGGTSGTPTDGGGGMGGSAGMGGCDASTKTMCGSAVAPSVSAGCTSCSSSGMTCQANGCYGGWWCNTSTNSCESPPTSCPPPPCAVDSGSGSGGTSGTGGAGSITCSSPGSYAKNGSGCGTERWAVKTGTDPKASSLSLVPQPTTITTLTSAPAIAGGWTTRSSPYETTLWELKDVTLTYLRLETDSDYHMVLTDTSHNTMIVEIPYPGTCDTGSSWSCFIQKSRSEVDAKYTVTSSSQYPGVVVTVRGFGMFDSIHGQTGVAPNGIELHPVLQICFGVGCTPS